MIQEFFDPDDYSSLEECMRAKKLRIREWQIKEKKIHETIDKDVPRGYITSGGIYDKTTRDIYVLNILNRKGR